MAINIHKTGLLEWTAGLTFCIKIIFMTKSKIPLPVSLYPAFDQSVLVYIYLKAQNHII